MKSSKEVICVTYGRKCANYLRKIIIAQQVVVVTNNAFHEGREASRNE
jgi:hypothetical protein